jgi:hypothetical protein
MAIWNDEMHNILGIGLVPGLLESWSSSNESTCLDAFSCGNALDLIELNEFDKIIFDSRCSRCVKEDVSNLLSSSTATTKMLVVNVDDELFQTENFSKLGVIVIVAPLTFALLDQYFG